LLGSNVTLYNAFLLGSTNSNLTLNLTNGNIQGTAT
jgi:hypothetical protein